MIKEATNIFGAVSIFAAIVYNGFLKEDERQSIKEQIGANSGQVVHSTRYVRPSTLDGRNSAIAARAFDLVKGELAKLPENEVTPQEIMVVKDCREQAAKQDYSYYENPRTAIEENAYVCVMERLR